MNVNTRLHPEGYHGTGRRPPFFEGWYFKIVDVTGQHRYAIIPGVSLAAGDGGPHSFIQVLDGASGQTLYQRYPLEDFHASHETLSVTVGRNTFSWQGMSLDLAGSAIPLTGVLRFNDPRPWPVNLLAPGIMGWYSWIPRMECYHGVLSLDHSLDGILTTNGTTADFAGGRGYIEKDWGQAFPSGWIWMQTNHFEEPGICLTASIAMIPWIGRTFPGFIVGLYLRGTLIRFATYTGARTVHLTAEGRTVTWAIQDGLYRLEIMATTPHAGLLRGPSRSAMERPVPETLSATIDVTLTARHSGARHSGAVLFRGRGSYGGMEIGGDIEPLLAAAD